MEKNDVDCVKTLNRVSIALRARFKRKILNYLDKHCYGIEMDESTENDMICELNWC